MYLYYVKNIKSGEYVTLKSVKETSKLTGLSKEMIALSLNKNIVVSNWKIRREKDIASKSNNVRYITKKQVEDGYLAEKDGHVMYFDDIRKMSQFTHVPSKTINMCIIDGGCANGWCFDIALKKDQV